MKIKRLLFLFSLPLLLAACTSYKNVPYLQNPEAVNDLEGTLPLYDAKIMPKDLLSITVNTTDPQAAAPFNLTVQTPVERGPDEHQHDDATHVAAIPGEQLRRDRLPCDRYAEGRRLDEERGGEPDP